jgi:hypothetical protein
MSPALARRTAALAGVALLVAVIALAATGSPFGDPDEEGPEQVAVPGGDWYRALAAPYPARSGKERTSCGHELGAETMGVAHPVLPCGVKVFISYGDHVVLTQVIDRGPSVPGREFDVTRPLAEKIGLEGTQRIRWRYAR